VDWGFVTRDFALEQRVSLTDEAQAMGPILPESSNFRRIGKLLSFKVNPLVEYKASSESCLYPLPLTIFMAYYVLQKDRDAHWGKVS
jgi:hypothetical protein